MRATRYEHGTFVGTSPAATTRGFIETTALHNKPVRMAKEEFTKATASIYLLVMIPMLIAFVFVFGIMTMVSDALGWYLLSWLFRALQIICVLVPIGILVAIGMVFIASRRSQ